MSGFINGWTDGWMDGGTDGRMDDSRVSGLKKFTHLPHTVQVCIYRSVLVRRRSVKQLLPLLCYCGVSQHCRVVLTLSSCDLSYELKIKSLFLCLIVCLRLKEHIPSVGLLNTWHQILSEGEIQDMTRYVLFLTLPDISL